MANKSLYLIDATAFCYRAFYALPGLATSFGQPTNAIYGFINILNKVIKDNHPDYLAVCFDVSRDTLRQQKFSAYKIQRPPMPDGLSSQIPLIKQIVKAYGLPIFEKNGYEADDIIAVMARYARSEGLLVTIVSSDKDILQLVDERIVVFSPYKDSGTLYDRLKVRERFSVDPEQVADIIALMGDDVDNIPGVPGIGEKTAVKLIVQFGSLAQLLKNIDKIGPEKIRASIRDNIEQIKLNEELVQLGQGLELEFTLDALKIKPADTQEIFRLFKYLEFKKLIKDIAPEKESLPAEEIVPLKDTEIAEALHPGDELALAGSELDNLVFFANGRFFSLDKAGTHIKNFLEDPRIKKIGHGLKENKLMLAKKGIILEGLYFDTLIAGYLLNPSRPEYGLEGLALDYLDASPQKAGLDPAKSLDLILKLRPKLAAELKEKSLQELFIKTEMPLVNILAEMELVGIKLDLQYLNRLSGELAEKLKDLVARIYDISGMEFNLNSPKQLRQILFEKLKLPVTKRTKTGPSTDEEVLRGLASSHSLPALLLEYRQLTKFKNTYVDALPLLADKKTARVHTSFNQAGTETGRLSSSNPNLQNIPIKTDIGARIRKCIISGGLGCQLLSCDYSQIELRLLAHMSGDAYLIRAFQDDKDIHRITAALINNIDEERVTAAMREMAKRINFGIVYGLSSWGLARDLNMPVEEAQNFIDAYFARYPGVKEYIDSQIKRARRDGFVTTILGRRRYLPQINDRNQMIRSMAERQAVNTPIQGSASDLIKLAMIHIDQGIRASSFKAQMILQIHDELVFDLPVDELNEFSGLAKDSMENVLKLSVPVRVSMKTGKNWLEMEPVHFAG